MIKMMFSLDRGVIRTHMLIKSLCTQIPTSVNLRYNYVYDLSFRPDVNRIL